MLMTMYGFLIIHVITCGWTLYILVILYLRFRLSLSFKKIHKNMCQTLQIVFIITTFPNTENGVIIWRCRLFLTNSEVFDISRQFKPKLGKKWRYQQAIWQGAEKNEKLCGNFGQYYAEESANYAEKTTNYAEFSRWFATDYFQRNDHGFAAHF